MGNKSVSVARRRRAQTWTRYYASKRPNKTSGDWITKECLNCNAEMILEPKEKNRKFCSLSCSTSYKNKRYDYSKRTTQSMGEVSQ